MYYMTSRKKDTVLREFQIISKTYARRFIFIVLIIFDFLAKEISPVFHQPMKISKCLKYVLTSKIQIWKQSIFLVKFKWKYSLQKCILNASFWYTISDPKIFYSVMLLSCATQKLFSAVISPAALNQFSNQLAPISS